MKTASFALTALMMSACAGTGVRDTATGSGEGSKSERANQNRQNRASGNGGFTMSAPSPSDKDWVGFYYSWQQNPISAESRESLRRAGVSAAQLESACKKLATRDRNYAWKDGHCVFVREDFAVISQVPQGLKLSINNSSNCRMDFLLSRTGRKALRAMVGNQAGRCQVAVEKTGERLSVKPTSSLQACACPSSTGVFPMVENAKRMDLRDRFTSASETI